MHAHYLFTFFIALAASVETSLAAPTSNLGAHSNLEKYNPTSGKLSQHPKVVGAGVLPREATGVIKRRWLSRLKDMAIGAVIGVSLVTLYIYNKVVPKTPKPSTSEGESSISLNANEMKQIEQIMAGKPEQAHSVVEQLKAQGMAAGADLEELEKLAEKYAGPKPKTGPNPERRSLLDLD